MLTSFHWWLAKHFAESRTMPPFCSSCSIHLHFTAHWGMYIFQTLFVPLHLHINNVCTATSLTALWLVKTRSFGGHLDGFQRVGRWWLFTSCHGVGRWFTCCSRCSFFNRNAWSSYYKSIHLCHVCVNTVPYFLEHFPRVL